MIVALDRPSTSCKIKSSPATVAESNRDRTSMAVLMTMAKKPVPSTLTLTSLLPTIQEIKENSRFEELSQAQKTNETTLVASTLKAIEITIEDPQRRTMMTVWKGTICTTTAMTSMVFSRTIGAYNDDWLTLYYFLPYRVLSGKYHLTSTIYMYSTKFKP